MLDKQSNRDSFLKRTEYLLKRKFDKYLENSIYSNLITKPENQIKLNSQSKILILRNDRIGDLLISVPVLRIIKSKYPDVQIDALISENNKSAQRGYEPYIHKLFIYQKNIFSLLKLIYNLRKIKYDLVIDLFDNPSSTNAFLVKFIKPINSLGIRKEKTNKYTFEVPLLNKNQFHIVERVSQLLLPFGINPENENLSLEFNISDKEIFEAQSLLGVKSKKFRLGINLSGSSRAKYWGLENFKKLILLVNAKYKHFQIIIFTTSEYNTDAEILSSSTNSITAPLVNSFNIYAAMISTCDILITPDTSAVHLSSAFKIPCIGLFIWSGLEEFGMPWTPYNTSNKCLTSKNNLIESIKSEEVFNAFEDLITENNLFE